ncbi:hypothetical protein UF12_00915 [Acinetobacter calcoaceticus]|nr:hypothetical protein UF12_00915 [Acinetobacter calcoaceticus]
MKFSTAKYLLFLCLFLVLSINRLNHYVKSEIFSVLKKRHLYIKGCILQYKHNFIFLLFRLNPFKQWQKFIERNSIYRLISQLLMQ